MSGTLNKVMIIGNLGRDPEVRMMPNGSKVVSLNMATSERWRDQDGSTREKTEWHRVSIFGRLAEIAEQYVRKGSKVYIEGRLQTRKWTDSNNVERYTTEIVASSMTMLDGRANGDRGFGGRVDAPDDFGGDFGPSPMGGGSSGHGMSDLDDDIPF